MDASIAAQPLVIAHRGYSERYPENTMVGFEAARRPGVEAIELDVQLSRDGVVVVYHDRSLERLSSRSCEVRSLDALELAAVDVGGWKGDSFIGEGIPRLADVVGRVSDREVWIEVKVHDGDAATGTGIRTIEAAIGVVERLGAMDRTRLLCFDRGTLDRAAERAPGIRRVWNLLGPVSRAAIESGVLPDAVDVDITTLTPEFSERVREMGLPLFTFTCNTDEMVERALAAGVSGIITDRPGWLVDRFSPGRG